MTLNVEPQTEYVYKTIGQRQLVMLMDYPPDWKITDNRAAIVFFFGGGWVKGTPAQFASQARYFADRGIVCARADYRLRTKDNVTIADCVEDAISAMRWMRGHAQGLGVNPNCIAAAGGSAGGHLAACTFFVESISAPTDDLTISPKPNALILYNPVLDLTHLPGVAAQRASAATTQGAEHGYTSGMDQQMIETVSPLLHANRQLPPTLIIDGSNDEFNGQIRAFIEKEKKLGVNVEAEFYEGQPHGFFNKEPYQTQTTKRAEQFLRRLGYVPKPAASKPASAAASAPSSQSASAPAE